jgi:D-3-phosphoglycerate dehydrogenase
MPSKRVLITTSSFGKDDDSALNALREAGYEPVLNPYSRKLTEEEVSQLLAEVKPVGMIAGVEPLTARVIAKSDGLKVISRCGIGLDSVDLAAAERSGIMVLNTPEGPTLAVAELTVGLMLAILRKIPSMDWGVRSGKWKRPMGMLLSGKTVGIIGCGRIGTSVAKLLSGFQCRLLGYDATITEHELIQLTDLESLLSESDIITLHVPYSQETHHLINADNLRRIKKGAIVLNTSRGGIVDEGALCQALKEGHLGGVGVDCYLEEPYEGELSRCEESVLTCHVGSYAKEARIQMERDAADNLLRALKSTGEER